MSRLSPRSRYRIAATILLASALGLFGGSLATAAENAPAPRTIVVSGEGEASGKPDQARLSAGVVTQAQTAAAALTANSTAMNRVFAALKMLNIPDAKIQISNFSVQPQYPPYRPDNPEPQRIIGYQVSNQVTVIVDDLANVGPALDALVRSGANQLGGIAFTIANPKPLAETARTAAVADGMAKARTLAMAAGVSLGPLLNLQETSGSRPIPVMAMARFQAVAAPAPPPIAEGEATVTVNVQMTYAIQ